MCCKFVDVINHIVCAWRINIRIVGSPLNQPISLLTVLISFLLLLILMERNAKDAVSGPGVSKFSKYDDWPFPSRQTSCSQSAAFPRPQTPINQSINQSPNQPINQTPMLITACPLFPTRKRIGEITFLGHTFPVVFTTQSPSSPNRLLFSHGCHPPSPSPALPKRTQLPKPLKHN